MPEQTKAADVTPGEAEYVDTGHLQDIPSSHDTCGEDPMAEVAATFDAPVE